LDTKKKDLKVLNGKFIRIVAEFEENKLKNIKVCGDFFIHPEDTIVFLEEEILKGKNFKESVMLWNEKYSPKIIGFELEDLIHALESLVDIENEE